MKEPKRRAIMKLDHVVYFSKKDPTENVRDQRQQGYHAVKGGSHVQWGTQNALLYGANAYVEWLSVEKSEVARMSTHPLTRLLLKDLEEGEGWGTLCIEIEAIEGFQKRLKDDGFKTSPIYPAQRKTPDGEILKWKMLFVFKDDDSDLPFPFFIEWEKTAEERLFNLRNNGSFPEENEAIRLKECVLATTEPEREKLLWQRLLGLDQEDSRVLELNRVQLTFVRKEPDEKARLKEVKIIKAP